MTWYIANYMCIYIEGHVFTFIIIIGVFSHAHMYVYHSEKAYKHPIGKLPISVIDDFRGGGRGTVYLSYIANNAKGVFTEKLCTTWLDN